MEPSPVDPRRRAPAHRPSDRVADDALVPLIPRVRGEHLRVGDAVEVEALGQDHGGRDERSGERPATGLVDTGDAREALLPQAPLVPPEVDR